MANQRLPRELAKLALPFCLISFVFLMLVPIPAFILDMGLTLSFLTSLAVFTIVLFIEKPLQFSLFPTVVLGSLVLRLALNIASTKLIVSQGHSGTAAAGGIIQGFAEFVVGGSILLGVTIFCVILIVNFFVITKGATRMAEVSARFALDSIPGKQMAIDSDVAAGAISSEEASIRRKTEQDEANFFGSLDGASKFVKGDAVAGILIIMLNLIVGILVGIFEHGMTTASAFETYAILTVGDGLVTQIPAVIISIATALLLSRGGAHGATDIAVAEQIGRYPLAILAVAVIMIALALSPGLPFAPFIIFGIVSLLIFRWADRRKSMNKALVKDQSSEAVEEVANKSISDILDLDDLHIEFASDLVPMLLEAGTGIESRIENMRKYIAEKFGMILPDVRLTDEPGLLNGEYRILLQGVEQGRGTLHPDLVLALRNQENVELPAGTDVLEPVYGAPARWIHKRNREKIAISGATVVSSEEIIATHLLEVIKKNLSRLLTLKSLRHLLAETTLVSDRKRAEANQQLLDELIPDKVPIDTLLDVLRLLLDEKISIRNISTILESIASARIHSSHPENICERVRQGLGFQIVSELKREDGTIPIVQLSTDWEGIFSEYQIEIAKGIQQVALPPDALNKLVTGLAQKNSETAETGVVAALATSAIRRRFLAGIVSGAKLSIPVLSFEEIGTIAQPALVGVVPLNE